MASKFVVAVALFALCHANPVLINGVLFRDGRSYAIGQASSTGGRSTALADAHGNTAHAQGSSTSGATLSRDGFYYPGQTYSEAKAQAQNGGYYPVLAPATITYGQNFEVPSEVSYEIPSAVIAQSSAVMNGGSESSMSSVTSNGDGVAVSSANTQGGSNRYGATSSSAKSNGHGTASSAAQTNGVAGVGYQVFPAQELPSVFDAKTPIYTAYVPNVPAPSASSNAYVTGAGKAASSAKIGQGRTISWRFGTLYDGAASAHTHSGYGAAKSAAHTHGNGLANANAKVSGFGSANSFADTRSAGYGSAKSTANAYDAGSANANAAVNSAGYGNSFANANAKSGYGNARSTADVHGGSKTYAHSDTFGNAASSARSQGADAISQVNSSSFGAGSAHANAVV